MMDWETRSPQAAGMNENWRLAGDFGAVDSIVLAKNGGLELMNCDDYFKLT
ncbi:hypothetical protein [Paenibacillus agricola]|uniref:hypothetical protein n=1 Tax=Paenibacillus agricola TaxID=2716264 RepID=UPI001A9D72EF|nr:hypothetical protein [Paenibacillus agricola]